MFRPNRVSFFVMLYLLIMRNRRVPIGSFLNIHELYDECPNPFYWEEVDKIEKERRQKKDCAFVSISNSRDITFIDNKIFGDGAGTFIETNGFVDGLNLTRNSVEGFDEFTFIDSKGDLRNTNMNNNNIRH